MTAITASVLSSAAMRFKSLAAELGCRFRRAIRAHRARRALRDIPDNLLRDVGLNRGDIRYVADALASGVGDPTRDPQDQLNLSAAQRAAMCNGAPRRVH